MGGRARHSVRAALGMQAVKLSPTAAIPMLLRNTLCKCLLLQHVTFAAKAPKMPAASPLASLSPQRGEGLRVRGGHIQSRLPRAPPVVDGVALRLRLPAEQALCGGVMPIAVRVISSPVSSVVWPTRAAWIAGHLSTKKPSKPPKYHFLRFENILQNYPTHRRQPAGGGARHSVRAAIDIQVGKLSQLPPSHCFAEHLITEH